MVFIPKLPFCSSKYKSNPKWNPKYKGTPNQPKTSIGEQHIITLTKGSNIIKLIFILESI